MNAKLKVRPHHTEGGFAAWVENGARADVFLGDTEVEALSRLCTYLDYRLRERDKVLDAVEKVVEDVRNNSENYVEPMHAGNPHTEV